MHFMGMNERSHTAEEEEAFDKGVEYAEQRILAIVEDLSIWDDKTLFINDTAEAGWQAALKELKTRINDG